MKKLFKKLLVMGMAGFLCVTNAVPAMAETVTVMSGTGKAVYRMDSNLTVKVGETKELNVTEVSADKNFVYNIQWSNTASSYASTSTSGGYGSYWGQPGRCRVTGKRAGKTSVTATIKVYTNDKSKTLVDQIKLTCNVTVTGASASGTGAGTNETQTKTVALNSIRMSTSSITMAPGKIALLSVSYNPSNTTVNKTVTWTSGNVAVAKVSSTGVVTAVKAGTATITAKVGNKSASCKITVKNASSSGITITDSSTSTGSYKNVSDAYSILNTFRTTKANQWYWNASNTGKITTYGLKTLTRNTALENVAKIRAKEAWTMYYEKNTKTHNRPDGSSCFTAYPSSLTYKGENLAWGQTSSSYVILNPTWGWAETNKKYADQGHRRNMLDSNFTKVGIACYVKDGKTCWAMCLGR